MIEIASSRRSSPRGCLRDRKFIPLEKNPPGHYKLKTYLYYNSETMDKLLILNFSHPLSAETKTKIQQATGMPISEERRMATQFDPAREFRPQVDALVQACALSADDWQLLPLLVVLPSLNTIAAMLLARLHGLMGHFPAVLRLREKAGQVPPIFEFAEIIDLQKIREDARAKSVDRFSDTDS